MKIVVGKEYTFDYPECFNTLSDYSEHRGRKVMVLRRLRDDELGDPSLEAMYEVQARDGWEGSAFETELVS